MQTVTFDEAQWKLVRCDDGAINSEMKAKCIGEFKFPVTDSCGECIDVGADEDCEVCGGEIQYDRSVDVPWDTCKEIYRALLDCAPSVEQQPPAGGVVVDRDTAERIAEMLEEDAASLFNSHTICGRWSDDDPVRAIHGEITATAKKLRALLAQPQQEVGQ